MPTIAMDQAATVPPARMPAARGAADWLGLAAAPTFGVMALLSILMRHEPSALICSTAFGLPWLTSMVPMYMLMSAFHLGPWLRLIGRNR